MASCSFCPEKAVSSYLVRVPILNAGKNPYGTRLQVVRVCETHKKQVPR
jgi:hypothetical protein